MDQVSGDGRAYLVDPPNSRIRVVFPGGKRKPHIVRAWGRHWSRGVESDALCGRLIRVESEIVNTDTNVMSNLCRVCVSMARRIGWISQEVAS